MYIVIYMNKQTKEVAEMPKTKLNSTGSLSSRIEKGVTKYYSYATCIGYISLSGRVVLIGEYFSNTTSKHLSILRDKHDLEKGDTFEVDAFKKRAELDNVDVVGGWIF